MVLHYMLKNLVFLAQHLPYMESREMGMQPLASSYRVSEGKTGRKNNRDKRRNSGLSSQTDLGLQLGKTQPGIILDLIRIPRWQDQDLAVIDC